VRPQRVLDRQFVEAQLARQVMELLLCRVAEVDPDDRRGLRQVLGHVREGEALGCQDPGAISPGQRLTHPRRPPL